MCFPVNLAKFLRKHFLQNNSGQLPLLLTFQKPPPRGSMKKLFLKISQNLQNTYTTATLLKLGTGNSVRKTLDEYSLSKNFNLKSTVEVYHRQHKPLMYIFVGLGCLLPEAATRGEMFCKNFVNFIGKHPCWSLFLIKLQA